MSAFSAAPAPTPAAAWQLLATGNARFVAGTPRHPHHSQWRRSELEQGQHPFATIFGCADSRVSPEIAFDRGLGDLFVVRNAGHVIDEASLGSIEYGVLHAHTPLLAVVGHEKCGCIAATMAAAVSGETPEGAIGGLVRRVMPAVEVAQECGATCAGEVMEEHVRQTVRGLLEQSPAIAEKVERGELAIVGLTYRLGDGTVSLLDYVGDLGRLNAPAAAAEAGSATSDHGFVAQQSAAAHSAASAAVALRPTTLHVAPDLDATPEGGHGPGPEMLDTVDAELVDLVD